jgi:hypothetical protein
MSAYQKAKGVQPSKIRSLLRNSLAVAWRRCVHSWLRALSKPLIILPENLQKSHFFVSGKQNYFQSSTIIGVAMNKFSKWIECREGQTSVLPAENSPATSVLGSRCHKPSESLGDERDALPSLAGVYEQRALVRSSKLLGYFREAEARPAYAEGQSNSRVKPESHLVQSSQTTFTGLPGRSRVKGSQGESSLVKVRQLGGFYLPVAQIVNLLSPTGSRPAGYLRGFQNSRVPCQTPVKRSQVWSSLVKPRQRSLRD